MKLKILLKASFFIGVIILHFNTNAQSFDSAMLNYQNKYAQERTYIQYDRSTYYPGETIWFKAYLMEGIFPVEGSKSLYIDWVDETGSVITHAVYPILEGGSHGNFEIPADFTGKQIHVRAYTKWMLNFDSSFIYNKTIPVLSKKQQTEKIQPQVTSLQFFPEGGDAIASLKNRIAFKANDQWGKPVKVKGVVVNDKNIFIDSIKTIHDGMGYFFIEPQQGVTYTAKWKDEKGASFTTALPAVKASGVTLQIIHQANKKRFVVSRTNDAGDDLKNLHLVGTVHQSLVFKTPLNLLDKEAVQGIIPTENIPTGLLTITVFDDKWNAIAERITYVNNNEYSFETQVEVQHWGLNKRARNEIQIKVPEDIAANLSVSVTDASIMSDNSNNIFTHLLLTSEIKGKVHNPAYYFSSNNETVAQHLDLVMMTNGWRRFKWEDVVKEKYPVITHPKDSSYLAFSGEIYGVNASLLRNAGNIVLIAKTKDSSNIIVVPIRGDGKFSDPNLVFFDSMQVYYQIQSNTLSNAAVRFMSDRINALDYKKMQPSFMHKYSVYDTTGTYRQYLLSEERARLIETAAGKMLANVTVTAKTKNPLEVLDEKYTSGLFRGDNSYQFDITKEIGAQAALNIFSFLQGRVAGLQVQTSGNNATLQWRGGTPTLYVDESPADVERVMSLPVQDIAYVKVFRPPFMGSFGGGSGGAIAIYTRKGGDQVRSEASKLKGTSIVGYTPFKEFYAPNYAGFDPRNEERDIRSTLYWNPMIITSPKKNIVTFYFYNNDVTKSFRVVIEGISKDGQLTHFEQVLE